MIRTRIVVALILALGLAVGCQTKKAPAPSPKPAETDTAGEAAKLKADADAAKVKADADAAKLKADADAAKVKADADAAQKEATSQLDKIQSLITDGKLGDADTLLKALEDKLATFSPDLQDKVKAVRAALAVKKAAASVIPTLP